MRTRLLPAALGLAVLIGGTTALAAPVQAAGPPSPVDITTLTAPVTPAAQHITSDTTGMYVGEAGVQQFVAQSTGQLSAARVNFAGTPGVTVAVYAGDQISFGPAEGLSLHRADLHVGTPIGSTTIAGETGIGVFSNTFEPAGTLTAGETYWIVMTDTNGLLVASDPSPTAYYWSGGSSTSFAAAPYAFQVDIDVAVPVRVTLSPSEPSGANGWYTEPVTATYTCSEDVDVCPSPTTVTADGDSSPTGLVTLDDGSRSFAWLHKVKIDKTPPTITGHAAPHGTGFEVTWTCDDATSLVATCPEPTIVSGLGTDTVATAEATDNAGNTKTGIVTGLVATTYAPALTINGVVPNKVYAHGTTVTPTCSTDRTRPEMFRARNGFLPPTVTCTGTSTSKTNKDGSVTWTYTATAIDTHELGGTTTKSVSWTIAAKAKPVVKPKPSLAGFTVKGLPKKTKNGHPVIDHKKKYKISFVFKDKNGKTIKGKPTWLHTVETNKSGTKGKPTKKLAFTKVKGVWTKTLTPAHHYKGEYRKFGVIAPNGKRYYVTIYVK